MRRSGPLYTPAALLSIKEPKYPVDRLFGPQSQSDIVKKNKISCPSLILNSSFVQLIA
jgi:hypothetical protein